MYLRKYFLSITLSLSIYSSYSQNIKTDYKLQQQLATLLDGFHGVAGVYVRNLKTNKIAAVNADTIFPTASIVKVPILIGIFDKINNGELQYHQPLLYRDSLKKSGSGLMQYFKDSTSTSLNVLAALMMSYSDNTTSLWCQSLAGGGAAINSILGQFGLKNTRVNSLTKGREENRKQYGWGQTTPREMAELLAMIRTGKVVSQQASEEMYRLMTHTFYGQYSVSQVPPYIQTASKQGMVNDSRSELLLVNAPHGDYVFYIATKNIKDTSWDDTTNDAWVLQRKVSAMLWNYFEPKDGWQAKNITK